MRPRHLVAVTGTGTEVGKTWVTCELLRAAVARGLSTSAHKPTQSWAPGDPTTDADLLAAAAGIPVDAVGDPAFSYEVPLAPPIAAAALGRTPARLADLLATIRGAASTDVAFVETAGGVRSPVAADADSRDLVTALAPDRVLLVAHAGLGTINDCRLTIGALAPHPAVVLLNRFDGTSRTHRTNREWLTDRDGFAVHTTDAPDWADTLLHALLYG